jgi:hypothetical protein
VAEVLPKPNKIGDMGGAELEKQGTKGEMSFKEAREFLKSIGIKPIEDLGEPLTICKRARKL